MNIREGGPSSTTTPPSLPPSQAPAGERYRWQWCGLKARSIARERRLQQAVGQAVEAYAKKLRKSQEEYEKIGRADEVAKLKAELAIVEEYLPKKASPEETERLVDDFLAKNSFTEKQVGQAMGAFMKAHGTTVDGGLVNPLFRKKLAGK